MSRNFSINIGNNGSIITLQKRKKIIETIFIDSLNNETKEKLNNIFTKNKGVKINIILDNVGQSYNKKKFPNVSYLDMIKMVNRKFKYEIPKTDLKGKIFLGKNKSTKEWEYLFVSSPIDAQLKEWMDYTEQLPNILNGVFMLPLESENFVEKLLKNLPEFKLNPAKWLLVIVNNKVSDLRQMAFYNNKLIFTRVLNQDINAPEFNKTIVNDIMRTAEYLKRYSTEFQVKDLVVVTVTSEVIKKSLLNIDIQPIKLINFNINYIAKKFNLSYMVSKDEEYCDLFFKEFILKSSKKKLKFSTNEMKFLNIISFFSKISNFVVYFLIFCTAIVIAFFAINNIIYFKKKITLEKKIKERKTFFKAEKLKEFGDKYEDIDEIINIGFFYLVADKYNKNFMNVFNILGDLNAKDLSKIKSLKFDLKNFNAIALNENSKISLNLEVDLKNSTGTMDDLFKKYDNYKKEFNTLFKSSKSVFSNLPTNIEYNKKHFTFPITINVDNIAEGKKL